MSTLSVAPSPHSLQMGTIWAIIWPEIKSVRKEEKMPYKIFQAGSLLLYVVRTGQNLNVGSVRYQAFLVQDFIGWKSLWDPRDSLEEALRDIQKSHPDANEIPGLGDFVLFDATVGGKPFWFLNQNFAEEQHEGPGEVRAVHLKEIRPGTRVSNKIDGLIVLWKGYGHVENGRYVE